MDNVQACIAPAYIIADDGKKYMACATSVEKAIYDDEGTRLDRKLNKIRSDISDMGYGSIVDTQTGEVVISTKSMNSYVELHEIYGQSSQDGIPMPDNPVDIINIEGNIKSCGVNYISLSDFLKPSAIGAYTHTEILDNGIRVYNQNADAYSNAQFTLYLPAGTYTLSYRMEVKSGVGGVSILTENVNGNTFEIDQNGKVTIAFFNSLGLSQPGDVIFTNIQINNGSIAEPFVGYATSAPLPMLCSVGNVKDKLYKDVNDGLWKIKRYIKNITLNGNENWKYADAYSTGDYAVFYLEGIVKSASRETMSDRFESWNGTDYRSVNKNILGINAALTNIDIGVKKTMASDIPTFKAWLSVNQTMAQYSLDKPEIEILPAEQQIRLNSLKSFEGKTTVYTASQIQPNLTVYFYSESVGYGIDRSKAIYNAIDLTIDKRFVRNTAVTEPGFIPDALLVANNTECIEKTENNILNAHSFASGSFLDGTPGWYRVAKFLNSNANAIRGSAADTCTITLKRTYSYINNEMVQINLDKVYRKTRFTLLRKFSNAQIITKIRHVYSEKEAFLEVLYENSSGNGLYVEIDNPGCSLGRWEAIVPEPTQETVAGYIVDAELDLTREYGSSLINDAYERYHLDSNTPLKLGINLREWSGNKCYLISYTGYWGEGSAHQAVMWLLSCGYNKDAYNIVEIGSTGKNDGYLPTFSVDSDGFIICTAKNKVGGFITVLRM